MAVIAMLFPLLLLALQIAVCVWGYRDSIRRGKSNEYAIVVLFGLLFFPIVGLIVYLIIRND